MVSNSGILIWTKASYSYTGFHTLLHRELGYVYSLENYIIIVKLKSEPLFVFYYLFWPKITNFYILLLSQFPNFCR